MSYEPLHHKYRPKTFADLVGQEAIATTLSNALRLSKIAPAYLFAGPRGTGKTSSARILAKSLNCLQSSEPTDRPCGVCDVCRSITNGSSLDVMEIDAASNTGVDNIRELIERSQFAPVQCRHKVYIIDECLAGDSLVLTNEGLLRIDDPTLQGKQVLSYNNFSGYWEFKPVLRWFDQGIKETLVIQTTHQEIRCTANHLIRTETGWMAAENLQPGMRILSPNLDMMGDRFEIEPIFESKNKGTIGRFDRVDYQIKDRGYRETVHCITPGKLEKVYDIEVQDNHNFVANGLNVHNCHSLSASSFNALLKTLEEPPDRVVFVLATTDPQRVLPTIISRCQRFDFRRIPLDAMVKHLQEIAEKESINITPEAMLTVAQIAQGGLRDAESMLDQLSLLSGEVTLEKVWDLVGAVPEQDLMALLQAIADDRPEAVLDRARAIMDRGREPLVVLQNLTGFYRDLLIAKTAGDRSDLVAITPATWEELRQFAQNQEFPQILQGQQHLRACEVQIKNTTQPRLWLEVALLGLLPSALNATTQVVRTPTSLSPQSGTQAIAQPPSRDRAVAAPAAQPANQKQYSQTSPVAAQTSAQTTPQIHQPGQVASVPPAAAATAPPVATGSPATSNLESLWQQVLSHLLPMSKALLLQHGTLIDVQEHEVRLAFRSQNLMKVAAERQLPQIKAAFTQVLGRPIEVHLEVSGKNSAQPSQTIQSQRQQATAPQTATPIARQPTPVPEVSQPLPSQNLPDRTAQPLQTSTIQNGQASLESIAQPKIPPKTTVNQPVDRVRPQPQQTTPGYVDESEAIAAAEKLADMFGGSVVIVSNDSDPFHRERVEENSPMVVEISNEVEDFPDVSEESRQEEAIAQPAIPEPAIPKPEIEPPVHLPENQQPTENVLSPAEEEEVLRSLAGEEFGDFDF